MDPIVCLHGGASRPATWDGFRARLAQDGASSVALTLLGHQGADRPGRYALGALVDDAVCQLDRLGGGSVTVVGHSLGAFVALSVAAYRPDVVSRLVLEEPPVPPRWVGDGRPTSRRAEVRMRLLAPLAPRRLDPRLLGQVLDQLSAPQPGWWRSLSSVTAPTLVLAGGPGSQLNQQRMHLLVAELPTARLEIVPVGHRIHTHDPDGFVALVLPFVTGQ